MYRISVTFSTAHKRKIKNQGLSDSTEQAWSLRYLHVQPTAYIRSCLRTPQLVLQITKFPTENYCHIAIDFCRNCDNLSTLTTDTTSKLDILGHDSHTLGVDGTQVGVLEQSNKVSFGSFLERQNSGGLETEIGLEVLSNLTNKTLEGGLADKEIGRLLVLADLTKSNSSRAITVGLLYTSGSRCGLTGSLSKQIRNNCLR